MSNKIIQENPQVVMNAISHARYNYFGGRLLVAEKIAATTMTKKSSRNIVPPILISPTP